METFAVGQQVEFSHPEYNENEFPMYIVWVDAPRAMVRQVLPEWAFEPTQIVNISDIKPV